MRKNFLVQDEAMGEKKPLSQMLCRGGHGTECFGFIFVYQKEPYIARLVSKLTMQVLEPLALASTSQVLQLCIYRSEHIIDTDVDKSLEESLDVPCFGGEEGIM